MFLCSLVCLVIRSKSKLEDNSNQVGINYKDQATSGVLSSHENICSKSSSKYEEKGNKKDNNIQVRYESSPNGICDHSSEEIVFQENSMDEPKNLKHLTDRDINNNKLTGEKDVSECQNYEHENLENVNSNLMHVKNFESMNQNEIEQNDNSIANGDTKDKTFYILSSTFVKELPESTQINEKSEKSESENENNTDTEKRNWLLEFAKYMIYCFVVDTICDYIYDRLHRFLSHHHELNQDIEAELKCIEPIHVICIEKPKNFQKAEELVRKIKDEDAVYMFKLDF